MPYGGIPANTIDSATPNSGHLSINLLGLLLLEGRGRLLLLERCLPPLLLERWPMRLLHNLARVRVVPAFTGVPRS